MILAERRGLAATPPRLLLMAAQAVRTLYWAITSPTTRGGRAICLTPDDRIVLVRHSYTQGWFLPGGTIEAAEDSQTGMLRELSEEIGLVGHGTTQALFTVEQRPNFKRDQQTVFVVRDAVLKPRLSLEIEAIGVFDPARPPADLHPSTRYKLDRWHSLEVGDNRNWADTTVPAEG